jgi:flagellar biosynthetic protein FliR
VEFIIDRLLCFGLVLTRLSAFFLILPVFGWNAIPVQIKVAATVLMAVFFAMIAPFGLDASRITGMEAGLLVASEAIYGMALGLVISLVFSAVKLSGNIIEQQMGMSMAQVIDPLTGEEAEPMGSMIEMIFILLFLAANGHHLFLLVVGRSYDTFAVGTIPTVSVLAKGIVEAGSTMLVASLRLAGPVLAAFISFPMRVGLGLLMVGIFIPFFNSFINEFADLMGKLLPL